MKLFRKVVLGGWTSVATLAGFGLSAYAESCNAITSNTAGLRDGQLFYASNANPAWTEMPAQGTNLSNQTVSFAYVVSETFETERSGVVILKTGRTRQPDEAQTARRFKAVQLTRNTQVFDNKTCGEPRFFGEGSVPAKDYDDYHDIGKSVGTNTTMDAFHFKYAARRNQCRTTNSNVGDSLAPQSRSNRGQFSFDTDVVDKATYSQFFIAFGITSAYASSENLEKQRVETRQYRVTSGRPSCILFSMLVPARAAFLRINDLEALSSSGYEAPKRAPERRWAISLP